MTPLRTHHPRDTPHAADARPRRPRALTTTETLLALAIATALLASGLWTANAWADNLQLHHNARILTKLSLAIERFERLTGQPLPGPATNAMAHLAEQQELRPLIHNLPVRIENDGRLTPLDAWNQPLAYLDNSQGTLAVGDFVSAGPDGVFGDPYASNPERQNALVDDQYASDFERLY